MLFLMSPRRDWLVFPAEYKARASIENGRIVIENGLARREIVISPNAASVSLKNLVTGEELIRAVKPEATVTLDGKELSVGGLTGQPDLAFLRPEWLKTMTSDPNALQYKSVSFGAPTAPFDYKPTGHFQRRQWPPKGAAATLEFAGHDLKVQVHLEIYDGIPLVSKWMTVTNTGSAKHTIDAYKSEFLGLIEGETFVAPQHGWRTPNVTPFSDYAFGGDSLGNAQPAIKWVADPHYETIVNYDRTQPVDLVSSPPLGPAQELAPGEFLTSHRTYLLLQDSTERERQALAVRRAMRTLAPWALESPLMLHLTSTQPDIDHRAMDQAAEVGFELVIFSFGSGLNMEDVSPANLAKFKEYTEYAHSKGLMVGGYSLLASRHIDADNDAINPKTGKTGGAIFGDSPCLGSKWGIEYFEHIKTFLSETGFDLLEHDGSYPGDVCASTTHPGHHGLADSQWTQFHQISEFYHWCRSRGIYLNVPDWYFLQGSNKSAMGYRESNWSLPRALQVIHARQNMFDGTWEKAPSMGWMFVPLVQYQGGGEAATIEPLKDHLQVYEQHLMNYLGFGVQACYRGPRLYDSPETEAMVKRRVAWFKGHREILESDIVHLRRADGRDWDGILHVNPALKTPALVMLYNPLEEPVTRAIRIPLHYSGMSGNVHVQIGDDKPGVVSLDPFQVGVITVTIPAEGSVSVSFLK